MLWQLLFVNMNVCKMENYPYIVQIFYSHCQVVHISKDGYMVNAKRSRLAESLVEQMVIAKCNADLLP
jgi:23S rRNA C2498 (ribose-2'-O)-methylase RlmM